MKGLAVVVVLLVLALVGSLSVRTAISDDTPKVVIVQWSNSHPMRDGLLPDMAAAFNKSKHETSSGTRIRVVVVSCDSSVQADDLVSRVKGAGGIDQGCTDEAGDRAADPTVVTPQSDDWLVDINHRAAREVVRRQDTKGIAETWLGIVTYRQMAECLGWPDRQVGYADILELLSDPRGWKRYPDCARVEWGSRPLLAFTNPSTSTSGRNVLISLYSMAAGKAPGQLTVADVERPDVVQYVKRFQGLVDHYMPGTIPLNTKIVQGERYGHFFLMPEDNLVSLYKGTEKAIAADGKTTTIHPVRDLVMIYPKEGSILNSNPAGVVDAPWVSGQQREAAREWIDYLRADAQQRKFEDAGFRPAAGTRAAVDKSQFRKWGLNPHRPRSVIEPGQLQAPVLEQIIGSWGAVKNPAVVTLVVDVSGSMAGAKLDHVKQGLARLLDAMSGTAGANNKVGLVTFSDRVTAEIPPAPLQEAKYPIGDAINSMRASGATALYDAIGRAIQLTDDAVGDARTSRAVIVLSDGEATAGRCLDTVVSMRSRTESRIPNFCGMGIDYARDARGTRVPIGDINGEDLVWPHHHDPVQVFFVGFGDANVQIGRILAQATGAEYQGSTDSDLATVIEALSGYF